MIFELIIIFGLPILAIIGLYFFFTITRAHRLRIRYNINGRKYIKDFLMSEKKDKQSKEIFWQTKAIWQPKIKVAKPPEKCIDVGLRGKYYAEGYVNTEMADGTLEVTWLRDGIDINQSTVLEADGKTIKDAFKPYSTTQRAFVVNQHKKELERKSRALTIDKIIQFGVIGMFFLTLIIGAIFAQDITTGISDMERGRADWVRQQAEITKMQLAITEALNVKVQDYDVVVSQKVKSTESNVITTTNEEQPKAFGMEYLE